ncbi:transporter substrate-binding domain-containing protein [Desulfobacterales bacterium HSG2]|nr:transporter substrate-binding domain-containing protein [Desulfobacterales bacterium HSG2]
MKKRVVTLVTIILLLFSANAMAEKLVFVTCEFPPLGFMKDGQPAGSQVEIVHEICNRLGLAAEIQVLPWKRAMMYAETGRAHAIFAAIRTKERNVFLYYPSEPLCFERAVILARKGSGIKVNSLDDLKGKGVYVVGGYAYTPEFDNHQGIKRVVCYDDKEVVKRLAKGHFHLAAGADEVTIKYFCKQVGFEAETVYVLNENPCYLAFSKKGTGPKAKSLAEKFSRTLRQLREEGVIRKIESKYF